MMKFFIEGTEEEVAQFKKFLVYVLEKRIEGPHGLLLTDLNFSAPTRESDGRVSSTGETQFRILKKLIPEKK
jgi:hypothetical protein